MNTYYLLWLISGILAAIYTYGTTYAHFQNRFPSIAKITKRQDMGMAAIFSLVSLICPIFGFIIFMLSGFNEYGFKLK